MLIPHPMRFLQPSCEQAQLLNSDLIAPLGGQITILESRIENGQRSVLTKRMAFDVLLRVRGRFRSLRPLQPPARA
jgi:hypothetical protein